MEVIDSETELDESDQDEFDDGEVEESEEEEDLLTKITENSAEYEDDSDIPEEIDLDEDEVSNSPVDQKTETKSATKQNDTSLFYSPEPELTANISKLLRDTGDNEYSDEEDDQQEEDSDIESVLESDDEDGIFLQDDDEEKSPEKMEEMSSEKSETNGDLVINTQVVGTENVDTNGVLNASNEDVHLADEFEAAGKEIIKDVVVEQPVVEVAEDPEVAQAMALEGELNGGQNNVEIAVNLENASNEPASEIQVEAIKTTESQEKEVASNSLIVADYNDSSPEGELSTTPVVSTGQLPPVCGNSILFTEEVVVESTGGETKIEDIEAACATFKADAVIVENCYESTGGTGEVTKAE